MPKQTRPIILSYGGGTQSIAICVLVTQGKLPKPERIVMADTGREASETWEYLHEHINPLLSTVGLQVEVAPHSLAKKDLHDRDGKPLIPVFTAGGMTQSFCSEFWKREVVNRWLRAEGYGPNHPVEKWIGISLDEIGRAKPDKAKWTRINWPLLMVHSPALKRSDCVRIVEESGLPTPPKSSCWMCPYRGNAQWQRMKERFPEDWAKATELDEEIRAADKFNAVYLHRSRVPLAEADLTVPTKSSPLFGEIEHCDSGYCMV